jgi:ATP-binding cassette subfamily C protein
MTEQIPDGIYIKTCQTLCRYFRLEMPQTGGDRDAWDDILRACGLRYTETILEGRWWKETNGAFLGELDDGTPVAVLPARVFGYTIYNPVDESMTPVNTAAAKRLRPGAYTIYRTFPPGKIGAPEVVRFVFSERVGKEIAFIVLFGFMASLLGALPPIITAQIFDEFVPGKMLGMIAQAVIILLCFDAAQMLFQMITNISVSRIKAKAGLALEAAVLDRILSQDLSFFEGTSAGETLRKVDAVNRLRGLVSPEAAKDILRGLFSFVSIAVLFRLDAGTARWTLLIFLVFILICAVVLMRCFRMHQALLEKETASESVNLQMARNAERIHDAGAAERAFAVWTEAENGKRRMVMKIRTWENGLYAFLKAFGIAGTACMFLAAAASEMSSAVFVGFAASFGMLQSSLTGLVKAMAKAPEFCAVCASLGPVLTEEKKSGKFCPRNMKAEIEVQGLSFFYGNFGSNVVDNLSFSLREGEMLGIYGRSGSGKTTLVKLLLGLYEPKAGRIAIGGYKNTTLDSTYLRRQWGVITQENELTSISLYRFLAGRGEIPAERIYQALAVVKMADQVRELGLQTRVEACGFSRGGMERLMAARIILGRQRLVIFDEPTDEHAFGVICSLNATRIITTNNTRFLEGCDKTINLA